MQAVLSTLCLDNKHPDLDGDVSKKLPCCCNHSTITPLVSSVVWCWVAHLLDTWCLCATKHINSDIICQKPCFYLSISHISVETKRTVNTGSLEARDFICGHVLNTVYTFRERKLIGRWVVIVRQQDAVCVNVHLLIQKPCKFQFSRILPLCTQIDKNFHIC